MISLISYADHRVMMREHSFLEEAFSCRWFDKIRVYHPEDLYTDFQENYGAYCRETQRGGGFWIWKPQIILQELERLRDGDILLYLDIGFTLNPSGGKKMTQTLALMADNSKPPVMAYQTPFIESAWCKQDLLHFMGCQGREDLLCTGQVACGALYIRVEEKSRKLIQEWAGVLKGGIQLWDDSPSRREECAGFREHRHDQSIFSLLMKREQMAVLDYASHIGGRECPGLLPLWCTRNRSGGHVNRWLELHGNVSPFSASPLYAHPSALPTATAKRHTLRYLLEKHQLQNFVETGTYHGDTTAVMAMHSANVQTIELSQDLYLAAKQRFSEMNHVHCWQGSSGERLAEMLENCPGPALIWLDGHYSGGITALGSEISPISKELKQEIGRAHV